MGKFKDKLAQVFNKVKNIEDNNYTPLNTFNLENNIMAQEAAINSQVGTTSILDNLNWSRWIHINQWVNYFANRFKYEASDYNHNLAINRVIRNGYLYGQCGIWNNNGSPLVVQVHNINKPENGKYKVSIVEDDAEDITYRRKEDINYLYVDMDQVKVYQYDSLGYSAFITLAPVLKLEQLIQKVLYNEILSNATRIIRNTEAGSDSKVAQQFINFNSPVIHKLASGSDTFNALTMDTKADKVIEVIEYSKNWYYEILGRRTNADFKKAHSLSTEIEAGQFNADVIERDRYMYLKKFLREYAKLFDISINLENLNGEMEDVFKEITIMNGEPTNEPENIN